MRPEAGPPLGRDRPAGARVKEAKFSACALRIRALPQGTRGAGDPCSFAGLLHVPRREAVTLAVNSLFRAELSAGADLSHAQLGLGGREAAGAAPRSPFFRYFLWVVFSGFREESRPLFVFLVRAAQTLKVPEQSRICAGGISGIRASGLLPPSRWPLESVSFGSSCLLAGSPHWSAGRAVCQVAPLWVLSIPARGPGGS